MQLREQARDHFSRPVPAMASLAIIVLWFTTSAMAQHTYYISKSLGSDSNSSAQAQSKSTSWAHLPGMQSCTANCASYSPVAGDSFILYGGDTWGNSDLGVNWQWSGSSSAVIYIGTDQTWYSSSVCGANFCRPIFNCGGAACAGANNDYFNVSANYVTFDDIEMTGLYKNDSNYGPDCYFFVNGLYIEAKNMYFHGWSLGPNGNNGGFAAWYGYAGGSALTGTQLHDSVFDGSDTAMNSLYGVWGGVEQLYNNYFRYLVADIVGLVNIEHDNTGEYYVTSASGDHCNLFYEEGPLSGTIVLIYNSVVRNTTTGCPGGVHYFINGYTGANSSFVAYFFNNVGYTLYPANVIDIAPSSGSGGNYGKYFLFNNTFECGNDSSQEACPGLPASTAGVTYTVNSLNNYWVTSVTACPSGNGATCNESSSLTQTVQTASGYGYTSSQTYAFSPTASNSPTVGQGANEQSLCTTISGINATAGTACQSDTTYGVGYNTSNHTVSAPGRPVNQRPASAAWDIGAYQYSATGTPNPPTKLGATVVPQ